jgi:Ca-activated chloride channel family protein
VEQKVSIAADAVAEPLFVLDAGTLVIRPLASPGAEVNDGAAVTVDYPGEGESITYGLSRVVVPAGDQQVKVKIGEGEVSETIPVKAGETVEKDIVVGVGRAVINAFYNDTLKVEDGGLAVNVAKAAKKIDGSRDGVAYGYGPDGGFDLPQGDYVAVAKMGEAEAEQPFSVKTGERSDVKVVLNAGVLAVSAPGASKIEVFAAAKDIQGNRQSVAFGYDQSLQTTLPAGDYAIVATRGDKTAEAATTIKAGERAEVTVP